MEASKMRDACPRCGVRLVPDTTCPPHDLKCYQCGRYFMSPVRTTMHEEFLRYEAALYRASVEHPTVIIYKKVCPGCGGEMSPSAKLCRPCSSSVRRNP
jgi:ribosomal protein L40E